MELILVVNAGSTSLKCALINVEGNVQRKIQCSWNNVPGEAFWKDSIKNERTVYFSSIQEILELTFQEVIDSSYDIQGIGHRIVHGGSLFQKPQKLTDETLKKLAPLSEIAPLHNPSNLSAIAVAKKFFPKLPQWGVFDTAFHATIPEEAARYPVPQKWLSWGIKRYGFHGINHEYCGRIAQTLIGTKCKHLITCHLGGGSSLCAHYEGKSKETSMGFSPLEGLMMGTRSGSIDPDVLIYLMQQKEFTAQQLLEILNFSSGMLAICGTSDFSEIEKLSQQGHQPYSLAYAMYLHRLKLYIGSMVGALSRLDALVFSGGIGEHSAMLREDVVRSLVYLGAEIDEKKNKTIFLDPAIISTPASQIHIMVIPAEEEVEIARQCWPLLNI